MKKTRGRFHLDQISAPDDFEVTCVVGERWITHSGIVLTIQNIVTYLTFQQAEQSLIESAKLSLPARGTPQACIWVTIPEERRSESFQYAPAPWAIAIVVFLSPITILNNNYFYCSIYKKMYTFDGYSTPITIVVFGAYFPSNLHFDFYSVCISTHVHNLYTVRKLALRPI